MRKTLKDVCRLVHFTNLFYYPNSEIFSLDNDNRNIQTVTENQAIEKCPINFNLIVLKEEISFYIT